MRLNRDSWHYKMWASSFSYYETKPLNTDLCRYCHRVFWQLFLRALLACMVCGCLFGLGYGVLYKGLFQHPLPTLAVLGVIGALVSVIVLYMRWYHGRPSPTLPKTLVGRYAQAAKQGVCPLVEFTGTAEVSVDSEED